MPREWSRRTLVETRVSRQKALGEEGISIRSISGGTPDRAVFPDGPVLPVSGEAAATERSDKSDQCQDTWRGRRHS